MEALSYLLQARANRGFSLDLTFLPWMAAFLIPLVLMLSFFSREFSWAAAVELSSLLLVLHSLIFVTFPPVGQLQRDATVHASLLAGRCYEEILGTPLSPREFVDPIAFHSLRECVQRGLLPAVMLCGLWLVLAPAWWMWAVLAVPAWILGLTWFLLPTSYATQQWTIYNTQLKSHSGGPGLERLCVVIVGMIPGAAMVVMLLSGALAFRMQEFRLAGAFALGYFLLGVTLARHLARDGLVRLPLLQENSRANHWRGSARAQRNPFVYCWSDNPIVVRERQRDARWVPGGWLGALFFQAPMVWALVVPLALSFPSKGVSSSSFAFYGFLIAVGWAQLFLACRRSSGAIIDEAVRQTLETMQNTPLPTGEFASGWIQVAAVPRMVENLVIFAVIYGLFGVKIVSPPLALLYALSFVSMPLVGASMGLLASFADQREKASAQMSNLLVTTFGIWIVFFAMVYGMLDIRLPAWATGLLCFLYLGAVLRYCLTRFLNQARRPVYHQQPEAPGGRF